MSKWVSVIPDENRNKIKEGNWMTYVGPEDENEPYSLDINLRKRIEKYLSKPDEKYVVEIVKFKKKESDKSNK